MYQAVHKTGANEILERGSFLFLAIGSKWKDESAPPVTIIISLATRRSGGAPSSFIRYILGDERHCAIKGCKMWHKERTLDSFWEASLMPQAVGATNPCIPPPFLICCCRIPASSCLFTPANLLHTSNTKIAIPRTSGKGTRSLTAYMGHGADSLISGMVVGENLTLLPPRPTLNQYKRAGRVMLFSGYQQQTRRLLGRDWTRMRGRSNE